MEQQTTPLQDQPIRVNEVFKMEPDMKSEFRKLAKGKYKTDLAKEVGVSRSTLNKLLKGEGNAISIQKAKDFIEKHAA